MPRSAPPERVFITGASTGIGRALALHYGRLGATLGLTARRAATLEEVARATGTRVATYPVDVRDASAMQRVGTDFVTRHGVPDIVIANAGVSHGTITSEPADLAVFEQIVDTNLTGLVRTFQPFVGAMRERGRGTLVGIASVAGVRGLPGAGAYSASKAGAIAYLESLRVELRTSGVRVVTLAPGYVDTPLTRHNPYRMPFLLDAEAAAVRFAAVIAAGRRFAVVPWQMAIVARVLAWLPPVLFDLLFERAPHKPRRSG